MMRLLHLSIRGFGQLQGEYPLEAGDGCAGLLLERNEAGKTTLVEAILAGLYGLPSDKRKVRKGLTQHERFDPWSGGPYGLTLRLLANGEELSIERDFRQDSARVLRAGVDLSDRYLRGKELKVGESLLGLTRQQFLRSAFVRQGEVEWGDASGLREALQRVAEATPGKITAAQALEALERGLNEYEGVQVKRGKVDTEVKKCASRIEELQRELDQLSAERERMGQRAQELRRSDQRKDTRDHRRLSLELAQQRIDHRELTENLAKADTALEELAKLEALDQAEASLLELDPAVLAAAEELRGRWQGAQKTAESYGKDAEASEAAARVAEEERDALKLHRTPRGEDLEAILETRTRVESAHQDRERYERTRVEERDAIAELGFTAESATGMLAGMEYLTPEDRHLLENRTRDRYAVDEERARLRQELSELQQQQDEIESQFNRRRRLGGAIAAIGAAGLALGLLFSMDWGLPTWLLPALGGAVIVLGLGLLFGPGSGRGKREQAAMSAAEACASRIREIEEKNQELEVAWQDLAHRLGIEAESLDERYRNLKLVERNLDTLNRIEARIAELDSLEEDALQRLETHWAPFGDEPRIELFEERIALLRKALESYRAADEALNLARNQKREADEKARAHQLRVKQATEALAACGILLEAEETLEDGYRRLKELEQKASVARVRREEEIPKARTRLVHPEELHDMRTRAEQLARQIQGAQDAGMEEVELRGESTAAQRDALEGLRAALEREVQEESEAREKALTEVRAFLKVYEEKAAPLIEELDEVREAHRRAQEYQLAVEMARDTLQEISTESYRDWARDLNREGVQLLERLGAGSRQLEFNEELGFSVQHEGRLLTNAEVDQMLSAGARDGIYLAARLAVTRVLGAQSEGLPLILDDPFAHCDDQRLLVGLRMLRAAAVEQQVLLLACQRSRYDWAMDQLGRPEGWVVLPLGS